MKVQLIYPDIDLRFPQMSFAGCYQPLGLIILANALRKNYGNSLEIEILDGSIITNDRIPQLLNADVVGISCNIFNYDTALNISRIAKEKGALVVLGGPHATAMKERILLNRKEIDYVIVREGENALVKIVLGESLSSIPNLVWRNKGNIRVNKYEKTSIHNREDFTRDWIPMQPYFDNFKNRNLQFSFKRPLQIQSQRGCLHRSQKGACIYCGRMGNDCEFRKPEEIWNEIKKVKKTYKIFCDSDTRRGIFITRR